MYTFSGFFVPATCVLTVACCLFAVMPAHGLGISPATIELPDILVNTTVSKEMRVSRSTDEGEQTLTILTDKKNKEITLSTTSVHMGPGERETSFTLYVHPLRPTKNGTMTQTLISLVPEIGSGADNTAVSAGVSTLVTYSATSTPVERAHIRDIDLSIVGDKQGYVKLRFYAQNEGNVPFEISHVLANFTQKGAGVGKQYRVDVNSLKVEPRKIVLLDQEFTEKISPGEYAVELTVLGSKGQMLYHGTEFSISLASPVIYASGEELEGAKEKNSSLPVLVGAGIGLVITLLSIIIISRRGA